MNDSRFSKHQANTTKTFLHNATRYLLTNSVLTSQLIGPCHIGDQRLGVPFHLVDHVLPDDGSYALQLTTLLNLSCSTDLKANGLSVNYRWKNVEQ